MELESVLSAVKEDRMIHIILGQDHRQETFTLQEAIIRKASRILSARLDREAKHGVLDCSSERVEAFKVVLYFVIEGKLPPTIPTPEVIHYSTDGDTGQDMQVLLVDCWLLGEEYEMPKFQNLIMHRLLDYIDECGSIATEAAEKAVEGRNNREDCKLRFMAVREVAYAVLEEHFYLGDILNEPFVAEGIAFAAARHGGGGRAPSDADAKGQRQEYMVAEDES